LIDEVTKNEIENSKIKSLDELENYISQLKESQREYFIEQLSPTGLISKKRIKKLL